MAKQLIFPYEGKDYTLEYTVDAVKEMEKRYAFDIQNADRMLINATEQLFMGAFLAHHRNTKQTVVAAMLDSVTNKKALNRLLSEMYIDVYMSYFDVDDDDADDEKNVPWTVVW